MAASGHYLASTAAYEILKQGGNAIDAGVAAGLCINVVQPDMTSLGGVAPIMIYHRETRRVSTIDGLGVWPRAASIEFFRERCGGDMPPGILRSVVPAAADAWITALARFGTLRFSQVAAPALELAEGGFPVYRFLYRNMLFDLPGYRRWPSTASTFLRDDAPLPPGTVLRQPELAATLRRMMRAEDSASTLGRDAGLDAARAEFYEGETAQTMARFAQAEGGLITAEDLRQFRVKLEEPVHVHYRGYDVYACGPWCQGPVLLQALNLLEPFDLAAWDHNGAEHLHVVLESLKLAFADREAYYGDPRMVDVPMEALLSKEYAAMRRRCLDMAHASTELPSPGDPYGFEQGRRKGALTGPSVETAQRNATWEPDTSYLCVVDRWGNAISATPSDSAASSPLVPGVGCIISSRGSQSWLAENHPSALAPGKRPRLTPSPAMVLRDGNVFMTLGTPGGDIQPQAMLQVLVNVIDFGMDLQTAVERERAATHSFPNSFWPHAYTPGLVCLDPGFPDGVVTRLADAGHRVQHLTQWERHRRTGVCAIRVDPTSRVLVGAADSRRESYAVGW
ncbi:MAG TPA: gamma-glutamyltransferase family protein [bacterium]|nr:gamma-glutamyltransferase family protein [bacterium]